MKFRQSHILLVLLLLAFVQGCSQPATRPWVDLKEINDQIVRTPAQEQTAEAGKDAANLSPRSRDLSVTAPSGQEGKKEQGAVVPQKGQGGDDGILLNFDNADIYEFIQVISDTLGINYIVDPKVKGSVNIHSAQKISQDKLFGVFEKILHVNGLDMSNEGTYYSIHPSKGGVPQQIYGPGEAGSLKASSRLVVQIVPVLHLASAEAKKLVEPYLSEVGSIYDLAGQNTLIVSDFESKVMDIVGVLSRLDISPLSAVKVRMVRVENTSLFTLRDELQEILTALTVNPKEHEAVSIIPLERINSLLLISKSEQLLDSTDRWIKELDVVPSDGRDTMYFYNVRNSVASELAALVNAFVSGEDVSAAGQVKSGRERESGTGLNKSSSSSGGFGDTQTKPLSTQKASDLKSESGLEGVSGLGNAGKSESFGKSGSSRATTGKRSGKNAPSLQFSGEPSLLADDGRNIILIRAEKQDYFRLIKLLERLDNLPRQVLIEVMVAEVTLNDSWEFGIEWALKNNQLNINGSKYTQYFSTGTGSTAASGFTSATGAISGLKSIGNNKAAGFAYSVFNSSGDLVGLLNAIAAQTDVSLLSSPQILVLNNEEAFVNVGDQVPIKTSESVPQDSTAFATSTIQYKDTGTLLKVRPRINYDGLIILDVDQQVSAATQNALGGTDSPIISTRQLKTKLAVKNGQSIMMGGLIKKGTTNEENKIPLLGDIPVLGWAFKYGKKSTAKTELLVMITPYVIESDDVLAQYIKKFQEKMQGLRQGLTEKGSVAASPIKEDRQGAHGE